MELLVGTMVMSLVLTTLTALFVASRNTIQQQILRVETLQALRATLDNLTRDLRLGGACLPTTGSLVALGGTNLANTDTIVSRAGLVDANLTCIVTTLHDPLPSTAGELTVEATTGFADGMRAYIRHPNGTGEFFTITHVDASASTLEKAGQSSQNYPVGSGVYAVDERTYAIDASNPSAPVLVLTKDGGTPTPFASGIEALGVQYELARNCPPCDVVDLPANDSEWMLVNEILVAVTARSRVPDRDGRYFRRVGRIAVKPRNLLPGSGVL
ncbi:MAG: hypothetical protein U0587_00390 [Candidatus Binatia bacterium]